MKAEQRQLIGLLLRGYFVRRRTEPQLPQQARQAVMYCIRPVIEEWREQRGNNESKNNRTVKITRYMPQLHAYKADDQTELGNLSKAHRGHHGIATIQTGKIKQRKEDDITAQQCHRCK